jgi:hypothetical protein
MVTIRVSRAATQTPRITLLAHAHATLPRWAVGRSKGNDLDGHRHTIIRMMNGAAEGGMAAMGAAEPV